MVTTIVHNYTSPASPMDVDTHTMTTEQETSHGEGEKYEDKPEEDHDSEQHGYQDEEGGHIVSRERGRRMADHGQVKGERKIRRSMLQLRKTRESGKGNDRGKGEQKG